MPDGKIYLYAEKTKKTFNRKEVLEYIEKRYGIEVALDVDINCTKTKRMEKDSM